MEKQFQKLKKELNIYLDQIKLIEELINKFYSIKIRKLMKNIFLIIYI